VTLAAAWSHLETPATFLGTGVVLAIVAVAMLHEYRRIFMQDPRAAMSAEVFMAVVSRSGGPGYLAAFVLAGALMFIALAIYHLIGALPRLLGF
jgi:hypothetical protein